MDISESYHSERTSDTITLRMDVVTPYQVDTRKRLRRDKTRKEALREWGKEIDGLFYDFKVGFRYSNYTHSGLKEFYPPTEIPQRPYITHIRDGCFIRTTPDFYIHIKGQLQGRQRWWARWAEPCGWLC